MHNCAQQGANKYSLNGPHSIKDAGQQDKRVCSWQWIELNQLKVFFCVMGKKRKKKETRSSKRSEAIKCLNIKKKNFVLKTMVGKEIKEISLDPCHTK